MKKIHLVKFSFGTNVHRNIPIEQPQYLATFFSNFFETQFSIDNSKPESFKTIPISIKRIASNGAVLAKKLIETLTNDFHLLDKDRKFVESEDLVVVDIKSNFRDTTILYLASELENLLKLDIANTTPRFVILLEDIPSTIESFKAIENFIKSGKVLLIDKKKRFLYGESPTKVNKTFSFNLISKSSLERTKFKLIRKIGHYGLYNDAFKTDLKACNQFFYDGRDCVQDISDVLFEKIVEYKEDKKFDITKIFFDCPDSPWLAESITILDSDLQLLKADYSFNYIDSQNVADVNEKSEKSENILFVVDLIHSAEVFKKRYSHLKLHFPKSEIKSLAIMVSDINQTYIDILDENTASIEVAHDDKVDVNFLLSVRQQRFDKATPCLMCNELHMEIVKDSTIINEDVLTSFEAWTMCDEAGYDKEDFVTDREAPFPNQISILPKRLELIKENSAFLAHKYKRHIEKTELLDPDLIVVFPDERTSKMELAKRQAPINLEDTASGYFAETLMQLKEVEYFGIPRGILDRIKLERDKTPDLSFIQTEYNDFYKRLLLLTDDIIIMDEFGLSGTTLKKIIAVLDIVKKKPKAYFPIFNFNPHILNSKKVGEYEVLSLYDFNLKVS